MSNLETAKALFLKGVELMAAADYAGAERNLRGALKILPSSAPILTRLSVALYEQRNLAEAYQTATRAVAADGRNVDAHLVMLGCLRAQGRSSEAFAVCERIIEIEPKFAQAFSMRAMMLGALERHGEALADHDKALALDPDSAPIHLNRGITLNDMERYAAAVSSYDRAIALRPDYAEAYSNRGNTLRNMGRLEEAIANYDKAIATNPALAEAHDNRGSALHSMAHFEEALASYDRAIALRPEFAEAHANRSAVLRMLKRDDEAMASADRAIAIRPDHAEAHWQKALLHLQRGDFREGWREYEWRWQSAQFASNQFSLHGREYDTPPWLGEESLPGKTILLHAEQGFAEVIQYCRYAREVEQRQAKVVLHVPVPLKELMASLSDTIGVITKTDAMPDYDLHCPLMSLPLALGTTLATVPGSVPYLAADPRKLRDWQDRLGERRKLRVGLAWPEGARAPLERQLAVPFDALAPLLGQDAQFHSLQRALRKPEREIPFAELGVSDHGEALADLGDLAALIAAMDLVIAADTMQAHLAGALGKPVWIVLPAVADVRWLIGREDSPWYPTARLFVQQRFGDWGEVMERVAKALQTAAAAG